MRGPAIAFNQLTLRIGSTSILQQVSFAVQSGSTHALIGPNGSGKSSLLKVLLGQLPHQGKVYLDWPERVGVVGYVPQALEFDRTLPMTVDDFMCVMLQKRPVLLGASKRQQADSEQALDRVGMLAKRKRRMGALSGGERQRVMLAQALIPAPDLLIVDEPMAALDEAGMAIFESLLTQCQQDGVTVLWVEHDLMAVRRLADRVTGLNRQLIFDGHPDTELSSAKLMSLFSAKPSAHADEQSVLVLGDSI